MPINHYFSNFPSTINNEQLLLEDILCESIAIQGTDVYYLPREAWSETDKIFGENIASRFEKAYVIEMYIKNTNGFEGDQDFFSKFGIETRQNSNFIVAKRTFNKYVPSSVTIRPREGDLIYVPVMSATYEVNFVDEEISFFTRGKRTPYMYELRCVEFRGGHEIIKTGISEVDNVDLNNSYQVVMVMNGSGDYRIGESVYQGATLSSSTASGRVAVWEPSTRNLQVIGVIGDFVYSANVIGAESGTRSTASTIDLLANNTYYDFSNNSDIRSEANTFVDRTEVNPFGTA